MIGNLLDLNAELVPTIIPEKAGIHASLERRWDSSVPGGGD